MAQQMGINVSNPISTLHIVDTQTHPRVLIEPNSTGTNKDVTLELKQLGGSGDYLRLKKYSLSSSESIGGISLTGHSTIFSGLQAGDLKIGALAANANIDFLSGGIRRVTFLSNGNVGIGTATPSALFHINGSASEIARFQAPTGYVSFYDGSNYRGYLQTSVNGFTIGTPSTSNDLDFRTNTLTRLNINGTTGQVTVSEKLNAQNGIRLTGPLQAQNESVGADGMILVSKGNATPAWEERKIGFEAYYPMLTSFEIPHLTNTTLTNYTERWDDGNVFNPTSGVFTAPSAGLYHFECMLYITNLDTLPFITDGTLVYGFTVNGFALGHAITDFKTSVLYYSHHLSQTFRLNQGDVVTLYAFHSNSTTNPVRIYGNGGATESFFKGYKIY